MNRRHALRTISAAGLTTFAAARLGAASIQEPQPQQKPTMPKSPFDDAPIVVQPLATGVWLLTGPGGNIAILPGRDGVTVIDSAMASRGDEVVKAVGAVSSLPIKWLFNTHYHFDHTGGNAAFGKAGATIVAHENVLKRLSTPQTLYVMQMTVPASPEIALPRITFDHAFTAHRGGPDIHAVTLPPAHTDGDTVFHIGDDLIHMGDLFNAGYPFMDRNDKASIDGMIAAADTVLKSCGPKTRLIPGHGPVSTPADLRAFRDMLSANRDAIAALVSAGKTREEAVAAKPTAKFDPRYGKGFLNGDLFTTMVYILMTAPK